MFPLTLGKVPRTRSIGTFYLETDTNGDEMVDGFEFILPSA